MFKKQKEIVGHAGAIYTCKTDDIFLYTGSADKYVTRWLVEKGVQDNFAINLGKPVYSIEFINSNKQLIVGLSDGSLHVFDLELKIEIKHFTQHIKPVFSIVNNETQAQFYVGDADGNFSIWNSITLELMIYLPLDCGKIRNVCCSENGELIVLSCQDGTTRIFDTTHFNEIITIDSHKDGATIAHFHPLNSALLLTGGKDALLKVWDWKSMTQIKSIPAHNYVIYSILFIENGNKFVTASRDKSIKIWDSETFQVIQKLDFKRGGHKHSVNSLSKLSEGSFSSVSDDKKVIIWQKEIDEIELT